MLFYNTTITEKQLAQILDYPYALPEDPAEAFGGMMTEVAYVEEPANDQQKQQLLTSFGVEKLKLDGVKTHFEKYNSMCKLIGVQLKMLVSEL